MCNMTWSSAFLSIDFPAVLLLNCARRVAEMNHRYPRLAAHSASDRRDNSMWIK